ncbi:proteasome inhibitor PI31 subunit [Daktulosphaira vitifoliae]|uniref:proteasome inhibitor PI31 subunit n=1 Tax=Daktulosphaira vitifoliae TaxID=58002 RepID=UPI0021AA2640|nr:proteasome inhibitor PI31 subunit [Daktulosphaira vitifoliae]
MAEGNTKFWILVLKMFQKDVNKCEDNVIILVHWLLLLNDFQVLKPGNENEVVNGDEPSDILPENWSLGDAYKLRYARGNKLFILNCVKAGESLIFNFYNVETKQVSSAALGNIATVIKYIMDMPNNRDDFLGTVNILQKDLIDPMQIISDDKKAASTQTQFQAKLAETTESPLLISRTEPSFGFARRDPFPTYGMPDLDPLGGLRQPGEGMLFDPLRVGGGRPGMFPGVPPSARFDPMQPPNADPFRSRRPNPDHMRPPDFDDNLYM